MNSFDRTNLSPYNNLNAPVNVAARFAFNGPHYTLEELRAMAEERKARGPDWEMPPHLVACPMCLDIFQCLVEGVPEISPAFRLRLEELRRQMGLGAAAKPVSGGRTWQLWLARAAALAVIVLGCLVVYRHYQARPVATVVIGLVADFDRQGADARAIPGGVVRNFESASVARLRDGSTLQIEPQTRLSIRRPLFGGMLVSLEHGAIEAEVLEQRRGRHFLVQTPLGSAMALGTRFKVEVKTEPVLVFEGGGMPSSTRVRGGAVAAVRVEVIEGVVLVRTERDSASLHAGQAALMREGQPAIEVEDGAVGSP